MKSLLYTVRILPIIITSMSEPLVSVIVPVYNASVYLERCVDSLVGQTLKAIEVILVNDGSTDTSGEICDNYAAKDDRITVIHQKNKGQTAARNAGLVVARGQYIHFVDSDDWIDLDMERIMYRQAAAHHADIVTCDAVFHTGTKAAEARQAFEAGVYDKKALIETVYPKLIYSGKFFYFGIYAAMWNKLFRRELVLPHIKDIDPAVRIGEDGLTTFACFMNAEKVVIIKDTLYHYRNDNTSSLTRSYCWEQFDSALLLIVYLRRLAKQHHATYDLTYQIDVYLLYNIRSIVLEEFYYRINKPYRHRYQYLRRIVTHPAVQEACDRVDFKREFNREQRRFFQLLQSDSFHRLLVVTVSQSINQRMYHYMRRAAYFTSPSATLYDVMSRVKKAVNQPKTLLLFSMVLPALDYMA